VAADAKGRRIDFWGMDAAEVDGVIGVLEAEGFRYDEHYEALYGAGWAMVGVRTTDFACARLVVEVLDGTYTR
jgi:hypothetical protein